MIDDDDAKTLGEEKKIAVLFLTVTVVGMVSIFIVTLLDAPFYVAVIVPILPMVVYIGACWKRDNGALTAEQVGDSFYYLGFLYTLFTIIASLVRLGFGDHGGETDMRELLGRFGLALLATGIGMAARLMLVQFRLDDAQATKVLRESVTRAMRTLTTEISSAIDQLRLMRSNVESAVDDTVGSLAERLRAAEEDRGSRLDKVFAEIAARQEAILSRLDDKVSSLKLEPERLHDDLRRAVEGIGEGVSGLTDRLAEAGAAARQQGQAWAAASQDIGVAASSIRDMASNVHGVAAVAEPLRKASESLGHLADVAGRIAPEVERAVSGLGEPLRATLTAANAEAAVIASLRSALDSELKHIRSLKEQLLAELQEATAATSQVYRAYAGHAEEITRRLGDADAPKTTK